MFKKTTTTHKINIAFGLIAVFLLILATNRIDNSHFQTAQNAVTSVYKDRVLAQNYLYNISNSLHKKQLHIVDGSENTRKAINKEIEILIEQFFATSLTKNEAITINSFQDSFTKLKEQEAKFYGKVYNDSHYEHDNLFNYRSSINDQIYKMQLDLNSLSIIQVKESRVITGMAQKSLDTNLIMSKMEIYSLLIVGVIFITIMFYRINKKEIK